NDGWRVSKTLPGEEFGQCVALGSGTLGGLRLHRAFFERVQNLLRTHPAERVAARRLRSAARVMADGAIGIEQRIAVLRISRQRKGANRGAEDTDQGPQFHNPISPANRRGS